jgi:alkanesulfonate monooxygenase SsuD/methylene tetrahydromethanopterin reductase-like flavin-dependent oxidoreductase (luciferase family)
MYCAATNAEAERDGGDYATNYYRFFSKLGGRADFFEKVTGQEMNRAGGVLLGDPENLTRRIGELRDTLGVDFLLMEVAQGGAPADKVIQALELFGTQVMPGLRRAGA